MIDDNFLANEEGERLVKYKDSAGWPTIGIGHKILPNENFDKGITKAQSRALFTKDKAIAVHHIQTLLPGVKLNDNQMTALLSIVFNNGSKPLCPKHTLGDAIRKRDWAAAASAFELYHHDHEHGHPCDKACEALRRRRIRERNIFTKPA